MCIQADHIYFQIWKAPETAHLRYLKISEKVNQLSNLKKKIKKKKIRKFCVLFMNSVLQNFYHEALRWANLPNEVLCWIRVTSLGSRQLSQLLRYNTYSRCKWKTDKETVVLFHLGFKKIFGSIRIKSKKTLITTFISFFPFKIFTWNLQYSLF